MTAPYISEKKYYEDRLTDAKQEAQRDMAIQNEFFTLKLLIVVTIILSGISAANYLLPIIAKTLMSI